MGMPWVAIVNSHLLLTFTRTKKQLSLGENLDNLKTLSVNSLPIHLPTLSQTITPNILDDVTQALPLIKNTLDTPIADGQVLEVNFKFPNNPDLNGLPIIVMMVAYQNYFIVNYVVEKPDSYEHIGQDDMNEAGINASQLHQYAMENFRNLANNGRNARIHGKPEEGILAVTMGGDFESSLVLLDDFWDKRIAGTFQDDYVIAILAKDLLFIVDRNNQQAMNHIRKMMAKFKAEKGVIVSEYFYYRKDKRWQLYSGYH